MLRLILILALLGPTVLFANDEIPTAFNWAEAKSRCQTGHLQSPELFMSEFSWGYTLDEMSDQFYETYDSGRRIQLHASYNSEKDAFTLPLELDEERVTVISKNFVKSVTRQIEVAIAKGFADYVFFPDMGHSHLYFPQDHWDNNFKNFDSSYPNKHKFYEKMLGDSKMRPLYHLAEQLQMQDENKVLIEDELLKFKYWNRNFVGHNDGSDKYSIEVAPLSKNYNTVGSMKGYHSYSAGFAVSASRDGCFPFIDKNGNTRYFDISLKDPRYDPDASGGGWDM